MNMTHTVLFLAASITAFTSGTTLAQDEEGQSPSTLEEVTVTAQKREQNLQDVGISIVAMTRDDLEQLRIFDAGQLAQHIPTV